MSSLGAAKDIDDVFTLVYVDDLSIRNYKKKIPTFRENLIRVMRIGNLGITKLGLIVGVHRLTIRNFIVDNNDNISFPTACKLNNFVLRLKKASMQDPGDPTVDLLKLQE